MRFFRSEEALRQWEANTSNVGGAMVALPAIWTLSKRWYHNRLSPDYHGRSPAEIVEIFDAVGLTSPFWQASSP